MCISSITDIDHEKMWLEQIKAFTHLNSAEATAYWNRRAATFGCKARTGSYASDLLQRMKLEPSYSVLDIGCGTGITTIPIAKIVRSVTALDLSLAMLDILKQGASQAGVSNINFINKNWDEAVIGEDIAEHDIVLASRCLSGISLADNLKKINRAARRACYITWRAARSDKFEAEVYRTIEKEYTLHPEYIIIYNILYKLGISASVDIFTSTNEEVYPSLEKAVGNISRGEAIDNRIKENLAALVERHFRYEDGHYSRRSTVRWALIYWNKE